MKKCPFPEVTEPQNRQTESKTERDRQRKRKTFPDSPSLFGCALLCSPPQLKEERGMRFQERNKLTMKSRGRSRGWLSATKERVVGESLKEAVMAPSTDE